MVLRLLIFFSVTLSLNLYGQPKVLDQNFIEKKIRHSTGVNSSGILYLHLDKNVYTNNEPIWFSAYLLNPDSTEARHDILVVSIADALNKKVFLTEKYEMAQSLSFGTLTLPDSIPPGDYSLIASTNIVNETGRPQCVFSTKINIKSINQQAFTSSVLLLDSVIKAGKVRAKVSVSIKDPKSKEMPVIEYEIGNKTSKGVFDSNKELVINIPEADLDSINSSLRIKVKVNKEIQHLSVKLPEVRKRKINVLFFPEGGDLSLGLENQVAWESLTEKQVPISVTGVLLKDGNPIDTIQTNSYGVGRFNLKPAAASKYELRLHPGSYSDETNIFPLPIAVDNGLVLHLPNPVANDTLVVNLRSKQEKLVEILLNSNKGAYALFKTISSEKERFIKLPLHQLPKGIWTITVFNEGKPLAERLFFAQHHLKINSQITTDSISYAKKDSVHVRFSIKDHLGKPVIGLFSVAAVQKNRLKNDFVNIENYLNLNHHVGNTPADPSGYGSQDPAYVDDILLTKGWRKYTWQEVLQSDANRNFYSNEITGRVIYKKKPLTSPVQLAMLGGKSLGLITTSNHGEFKIEKEKLFATEGKKITVMVSGKNNSTYQIEINDPYGKNNSWIAEHLPIITSGSFSNTSNSSDNELKGLENAYNLQEVTIRAKNNSGGLYAFKGEPGTNDCGDFVDEAGHFNYEKATKRFKPKPNTLYVIRTDLNGSWFTVKPYYYTGCPEQEKTTLKISGIYGERTFYGVNTQPGEIQYLSTLFWRPGIKTDENGNASFSFKTSDISGDFVINVQGITDNNVFSGTKDFSVR